MREEYDLFYCGTLQVFPGLHPFEEFLSTLKQ